MDPTGAAYRKGHAMLWGMEGFTHKCVHMKELKAGLWTDSYCREFTEATK